jgi:NAD(P)-dependent dehydrogenase (short-subunit alcohol dehydrogenase family)
MGIELKGKVALVTGGAQGIGLGIVEAFLEAKAKVALSDINAEQLKVTAERLKTRFGKDNVYPIVADVTSEESVRKMVANTIKKFGAIEILVNNAGTGRMKPFWEISSEEWDIVLNINLKGTLFCSKAVAKHMIDKGIKGRIISISSINDHMATTGMSAYCASKAGISMFTRVAALEVGQYGINVNAIAPGYITTPATDSLFNLPNFKKAALERSPKGRYGEPKDVGKVALFLASEYAEWLTGQVINADGGASLMGLPMYYEAVTKGNVI